MHATQQRPAPAGTPGRHPIRRAQFELGKVVDRLHRRALSLWKGGPPADPGVPAATRRAAASELLAPGAMVVQKGASSDSIQIWVGVVVDVTAAEQLPVQLVVSGPDGEPDLTAEVVLQWYAVDSERESSGLPGGLRFFHAHHVVEGLQPDRQYGVRLADDLLGAAAPIVARTLPGALERGRSLRVFAGSCYDYTNDPGDALDTAFHQVFDDRRPDLTLLLGDQVYADSPAWHYALLSRHHPRTGLLTKYWRAWGMQPDPDGTDRKGLRSVLTSGPTYFLPDDHEFWNNWPNRTALAKHSYGKIANALWGDRQRSHARIPDGDTAGVEPPFDPRIAPWDRYQQNYLPVHPAEWDAWGLASFELFESFQTPGRLSLGERELPPTGAPPAPERRRIHRPRHPILQVVPIAPLTVALLDTRTRRTRRLRHERLSGFVDQEYLDAMLREAARADVFVLALSQPVLQRAAWRPDNGSAEPTGLFGDTAMHDYWYQWQRFWTGLLAARAGRPTITIGGDIHQSYLAFAREQSLIEVVASPMSLVVGGAALERAARAWAGLTRTKPDYDYDRGKAFVEMAEVVAGPGTPLTARPVTGRAVSKGCLPKNRPGFAELGFERTGDHSVRFDVRIFDRDGGTPGGAGPTAEVAASFRLDFGDDPGTTELG